MLERTQHENGLTLLQGVNVWEMVDAIAPALALENSMELRMGLWNRLVALELVGSVVALPAGGALAVPFEGRVRWTRPGAPEARNVDLNELLRDDLAFAELYWRELTSQETLDQAFAIVSPVYQSTRGLSPARFSKLMSYAPLIEKIAYKHVTMISMLLDRARPNIIDSLSKGGYQTREIVAYWQAVRIMGVLTLLASEPGAGVWLAEMSKEFRWTTWTPSFWLVRERSSGLALAAGHSAEAFGPSALDAYGEMLGAADHPMRAFDALFGICAIGRGSTELAASAIATIEQQRKRHFVTIRDHAEYFSALHGGALEMLQRVGNEKKSRRQETTNVQILDDPATFLANGDLVGFKYLEGLGSLEDTFRRVFATSSQREITERGIIRWFRSTWAPQERTFH
ncbi:hypothetical protein [Rhizobium sp. Rhizsp42]|uniref:hypothetical protein n=1 Tax=Rhizobium sp. Rhizsp42 TaxID=3243034 RepID=UPI0011D07D2C